MPLSNTTGDFTRTHLDPSASPTFQVIVLGSGGGPSEDNVTGLLVRSTATQWAKGSILAVDAGVHLAAVIKIIEEHLPNAIPRNQPDPVPSAPIKFTRHAPALAGNNGVSGINSADRKASEVLSPLATPDSAKAKYVLQTGPFAGVALPCEAARPNAAHLIRSLISTYLITHPHLDHLSGFAVNTASFQHTSRPKRLAALPSTIDAIKTHIFNDVIWPNLSDEEGGVGLVSYMRLAEGGNVALGEGEGKGYIELCEGLSVKSWSISHGHCMKRHSHRGSASGGVDDPESSPQLSRTLRSRQKESPPPISRTPSQPMGLLHKECVYDSTAFFIRDEGTGKEVLIFGDVEPDSISLSPRSARVWTDAASKIVSGLLTGIFIECSYDDSQSDELLFGHLAPRHLIAELQVLADKVRAIRNEEELAFHRKRKRQSNGSKMHEDPEIRNRRGRAPHRRRGKQANSGPSARESEEPQSFAGTVEFQTELLPDVLENSSEERLPLQGLHVVIIHMKDTLKDGPEVGEVILSQLQEYEKKAKLGSKFVISKSGTMDEAPPPLVRKLAIYAAKDGLVLRPSAQRKQPTASSFMVRYKSLEVRTLDPVQIASIDGGISAPLHSYGIVGLIRVASNAYLVSILGKEHVATIKGKAIYVVTRVEALPLSTRSEATDALFEANENLRRAANGSKDSKIPERDSSDDEEDPLCEDHDAVSGKALENTKGVFTPGKEKAETSVAEDVISNKGQYGRFAERWFSRKGWAVERQRMLGLSLGESERRPSSDPRMNRVAEFEDPHQAGADPHDGGGEVSSGGPASTTQKLSEQTAVDHAGTTLDEPSKVVITDGIAQKLGPKILRTTKLLFESRSFFFSYDYDITRRIGTQEGKGSSLPLHKTVDSMYFWNRHLVSSLIEGGHDSLVLPMMQGFVGQRSITADNAKAPSPTITAAEDNVQNIAQLQEDATKSKEAVAPSSQRDFLVTLISRRSVKRPGLRYLRRGVDDGGWCANSVETEQILCTPTWARVYSVTQIRGSIPLYFSQSPYSLKPLPVLQHSFEINDLAFRKHFKYLAKRYGYVQIALLVDKSGGEAYIGDEYEHHTRALNEYSGDKDAEIGFEWFDFHAACKGMRFENVSILTEALGSRLDSFGTHVEVDGKTQKRQKGVLRSNCMDCLDRTNVVQSAFAQRSLEQQLKQEGVDVNFQVDETTKWFNTLWADHGDAISKQYASTSALKGDFTRTRKRNYRGAINDLGLTLSRYYSNIFNDYFLQAVMDYLLGNVTFQVFEEFEVDMMSRDPAMSMQKMRHNAIDTSSKLVIADESEDLLGGWTLLSPHEQNTVRTFPFEESVLLLTGDALYAVRFDWNTDKVASFEHVELGSITGIMRGTYITSTLAAAQTDESRNVGFVVKYQPGKADVSRANTRSVSSASSAAAAGTGDNRDSDVDVAAVADSPGIKPKPAKQDPALKILAFKAVPARSSLASDESQSEGIIGETELVRDICDQISKAALPGRGEDGWAEFVEEKDIISVGEARKSTGYLEQGWHSLKKLVWA